MKYLFNLFILIVLTLSCKQAKAPVVSSPLPEESLRLVVYSLEVTPANKYQGFISYINKDGKLDSALTSKPWLYEFEAKTGTLLRATVAARPINPKERARGMVTFKVFVDGHTLDSGVGRGYSFEQKLE
jgi:hypothetical protein